MQILSLKIYLVLLCTGRNIHNRRNRDLFESSSSCFAVFSQNGFVGWRGGIKAAALSFKRNVRISSFLVRKQTTREPALVCGSGSSDLPTAQKLCRSSWEWMKRLNKATQEMVSSTTLIIFHWLIFLFLFKNQICWTSLHNRFRCVTVTRRPHMNTRGTVRRAFWLQKLWRFSRTRLKLVW